MAEEDECKSLLVHSFDWKTKDQDGDEGQATIHCWGLDRESKPHLLIFPNFPVFCYLKLPWVVNNKVFSWNKAKAKYVYDAISKKLNINESKPDSKDHRPKTEFIFSYKTLLYGFSDTVNDRGELVTNKSPCIMLFFKTIESMKVCKNKLNYPLYVPQLYSKNGIKCELYETNIDPIRKLLTYRNVKYTQWFTINGIKVSSNDRISVLENEYIVDWQSMLSVPNEESKDWVTNPSVLCFDIESYSDKKGVFTNAMNVNHVAYMISCVFQRVGMNNIKERHLIMLDNTEFLEGVNIIRVSDEVELCRAFESLINELNPDIITGYNILGYDYKYLTGRLQWRGLTWNQMGRIRGEKAIYESRSWKSSGYGTNEINAVHITGRMNLDMFPVIKRDYKLPKYNLETVGMEFLGRGKNDVSANQMFEIHDDAIEAKEILDMITLNYFDLGIESSDSRSIAKCWQPPNIDQIDYETLMVEVESYVQEPDNMNAERFASEYPNIPYIWTKNGRQSRWCRPKFDNINVDVKAIAETLLFYNEKKKETSKVSAYCVVDSDLVLDLMEKLVIWIGLIELSAVVGVVPYDLFTKGQQIRGLSQVYNLACNRDIVITNRITEPIKWSGGFVFEPKPGVYDCVQCLDFNSLYPNIIRAYNICWTTLVLPENTTIPDHMCHVFEFDEKELDDVFDEDGEEIIGEDGDETVGNTNTKTVAVKKQRHRFLKAEYKKGILPELVGILVDERKAVRVIQKTVQYGSLYWQVLEKRQLALKVSANSMFGMLGVQKNGMLPLIEGAMCITAKGRELIIQCNDYLEEKYGADIIYNDTDSTMIVIPGLTPKESVIKGKALEKELSDLFPNFLQLELEKTGRMACFRKKKYVFWGYDSEGELKYKKIKDERGKDTKDYVLDDNGEKVPDIMVKGIVLARRDNCKFQRDFYEKVLFQVIKRKDINQTLEIIACECLRLLRGEINWADLTIIRGLGGNYKLETYFMKIFGDELKELGKPAQAGERLEYVIVKNRDPNVKELLGYKMRLPETYLERLGTEQEEELDYMYYLEKVLMNSIQQVWALGYKHLLDDIEAANLMETYQNILREVAGASNGRFVNEVEETIVEAENNYIKAYNMLIEKKIKGMKAHIDKARSKWKSGREYVEMRMCTTPIKNMLRALSKNRFRDLMENYMSEDTFSREFPIKLVIT